MFSKIFEYELKVSMEHLVIDKYLDCVHPPTLNLSRLLQFYTFKIFFIHVYSILDGTPF